MERLTSGFYRHSTAVLHDISTIASNASLYNGEDSVIAKEAQGGCLKRVVVLDVYVVSECSCVSHTLPLS